MFIGIDVGGTDIKSGLVDRKNNLVFDQIRSTGNSLDEIVSNLSYIIEELKELSEGKYGKEISGIGIGIPGVISQGLDIVYESPNLKWRGLPLRDMLKEKTSYSVVLGNDANLATLAEFHIGSLKGVDTGVLLTLGTGVGGGAIINGKLFRGGNGVGFEIGHMVIGDNFFNCGCGKNGCLESFASATAIVKYYKHLLELKGKKPGSDITAKEIFTSAAASEELSLLAFEHYTTYLAKGLVNIINILDPEVITLGGGVSAAGEFLLESLNRKVSENLLVKNIPHARINIASAGNKAGIIGAALLAKDEAPQ